MTTDKAKEVLRIEAEGILALLDQVGPDFDKAVDLIMSCPSRVIITGIGKSGIIAQKIAATLNSTGTASFFLHPVEAMHGDLGIVDQRDVVLAISYSGETAELNLLVNSLKNRLVSIISMTGNPESTLAKLGDAVLNIAVPREACPLGLAPTAIANDRFDPEPCRTVTSETVVGRVVAVDRRVVIEHESGRGTVRVAVAVASGARSIEERLDVAVEFDIDRALWLRRHNGLAPGIFAQQRGLVHQTQDVVVRPRRRSILEVE